MRLLNRIEREVSVQDWEDFQANILIHLGFELAPRSIQLHSLDISDFEFVETSVHDKYYTLWLPMAKKVGQRRPERRPRKITPRLGEKIEQHISELQLPLWQRLRGPVCQSDWIALICLGDRRGPQTRAARSRHRTAKSSVDAAASSPRARLGGSGDASRNDRRVAWPQQHSRGARLCHGDPEYCPHQRESAGQEPGLSTHYAQSLNRKYCSAPRLGS